MKTRSRRRTRRRLDSRCPCYNIETKSTDFKENNQELAG